MCQRNIDYPEYGANSCPAPEEDSVGLCHEKLPYGLIFGNTMQRGGLELLLEERRRPFAVEGQRGHPATFKAKGTYDVCSGVHRQ